MLYAENVTKSFGPVDVIRDLNFIVGDGEHAGLVGPNGGGKSTILRLIAGEHKADSGAAGYRGASLGYLRQEAGLKDENTLAGALGGVPRGARLNSSWRTSPRRSSGGTTAWTR
ncbi:MAG: ATP-binding cassette domain-containing protein [Dehalococcoidia bacterium]|uniref:ATP-binding cassette domain-containing protein n=1 Tax=Candidatus Amarobacter glycogenicus TaxID=3140699 RepID=UPI00313739EC|nr:ATP-binding cassette domain-containing protein [Dehalococcoidia bacterium]